ncbi:MAG TPA: amino acid adenylation domain-containing protein, partial [Pyrinomonadaceae bacterium]
GVSLSLADLLESPSLEQLAARAAVRPSSASPGAETPAPPERTERGLRPPGAEETWLPLSHNQRALWFLHQVSPDSTAYNVAFAARIRGGLDAEALRRALRSLVERHAALRTSFALVGDEPAQRVHARAELFFRAEDAGDLDDDALGERLSLESRHHFDLGEPALLRVFLFERGAAGHVLLLVAHHIVVDFWSLSVLMRELWALYEAEVSGVRADLGPSASRYADYVGRQREFLDGAEGERQRDFWRRELSGELPVLDLPLDRPRPAVQSHRGASTSLRLGEALTGGLKSLSRSNEATLYMTLLAAFQVLLYRHTGQRELLTGTPTSGRGSALFSETVGYFVNPVVVRSKLSGGMAFTELLAQVRRTALAAFAHQDYPFDLLVKELQPQRDPARPPLFQAMFALHKAREAGGQSLAAFALGEAGAEVTLGGLTLESLALEQRAAQFDLALTMAEVDGGLSASFEFCTDLFEAATIERLAEHFRVLLEAIVAEPSRAVAGLAVLTGAEREQLLGVWNEPPRVPTPGRWVHTEFERQAALAPERVAVVCAGERVSYGELNARADLLARHLRARGVGPNVPVALCVERSIEMLVGIFGVLKAGGAYVPLDPSYPRERLAFMLRDSAAACLLTQKHLSERLPATDGHVIRLDADWPTIAREDDASPGREVGADNVAYVIYTSGSTGVPKGVMIGHGSLANYVGWVADEYGVTPEDRLLQFASFSFDVSAEEIFASLTRGATLVLRDDEMTAAPASLARACGEHGITVLNLPTAYWHQLAASLTASDWAAADRLRLVVIGSEKVQPERLSRWHACVGARVRLVDVYGPTEATIGSTVCDLTGLGGTGADAGRVSIGRPVRNAQAYVLDALLEPVPVGVAGELHVGGLGLALGYLNRPGLTAEKFIPHPFGHAPGARLYKTGDLARFLPDGRIEFLGRLDAQVKVRGFRIELGEIEQALAGHAGVRDAAVVVREDAGEKRLVAYIVAAESDAPAAGDLRRHLKGRLPEYMLPSAFVFLERLPLTPGGKVDTRALPAPDRTRPELAGGFVAPRGEVEHALARIWADVLKLERVGVDDNFFELGGDSILAIQVIARAQAERLSLTAKQMFTHPTVAELAAVTVTAPAAAEQAEQAAATGEVPLTPIQRWFFAQEFEDADHWNMAVMLEVGRPLPCDELERALVQLVNRHEALRLRFAREAEGWRQFVTEDARAQFALDRVDLSATAEAEQPAAIEAAAAEAQSRLSLSEGPLLRAVLFEPREGRAPRLLLVAHHLIIDGVSWGILLEDLASLCEQTRSGVPSELPPKTTSFKSWAERLESYAASSAARAGADYWSALASKESRGLPVDYPGGANGEADARTVSVTLSAGETRALLHEVPAAYHTQINDVLLTALAAAFARRTGESELLLELESHGREELSEGVNLSRTIGWFTSAYPVLLRLNEPFAPGEALKSVKEQLRAIPGNGIDYGVLRYLNADAPPMSDVPRPGVSFNYLGRLDRLLDDASLFRTAREGAGPTRGGRNRRTHLLEVNAGVYDGRLRVDWSYSAGLHTKATVEGLATGYVTALGEIIAHCLWPGAGGHTPSDFPLARLDQRGLDALLKATGPVADLYPLTPTQHGMLFHCLYSPEAGVYMGQLSCVIEGELDEPAFAEAWRRGAERHASLRASFVWENLDEPLQVVAQSVEVRPEVRDWRGSSAAEQGRLFESFLADDWARAFDLGRAPLMRLALLRTADETYRFVWTHHHLLLDGWSASLLMREVLDIYEALRRGDEPPPARARAFRDYVRWLRGQDASAAEGFWREELKGFTSPTPLPSGWPAASEPPRASKRQLRLGTEETAALQGFARRHKLTLSTLVHGTFALLLSRYSAEEDVVFGTAVSGRPPALAGVDSMTGLFINTLPVRVRVADASPALPWLKGLQDRLVALREYEYSSLAEVQRSSDMPHGTPLFESLLVFENYPMDATLGGLEGHLKLGDVRSFELTNYPLTVVALPGAELSLQALFTSDRFDAATVERLLGHLKSLLLDIAASPEAPLGDARLMGEDERRRMLEEWNGTAHAHAREGGVGKLFEGRAAAQPEAAALVAGGRRMTFGELNRRANQVAHHLRRLGVGPESIVGVCLERSMEMVVGLLGALKAGAAYMPMDPAYPRDRLTFMARDARAPVLLTQASLGELFADEGARVLRLDADWEVFAGEPEGDPPGVVEPENLAYVIYTSGSTGRPKGVAVTQGSLLNLIGWYRRTFAVTPSDKSTYLSGIGFDVSVMDLWTNLTSGVCVFIPDEETRLSTEKLRDWFVANEITVGFAATPMAEMLLELSWPETAALRTLTTGGDKLHRYPKDSLRFNVANLYGPTENTVVTTCEISEPGGDEPTTSPPIGRPLDNVEVYVLDRRLRPVPIGVTGELYVGGDGLARGYWGRPDMTAERFIPHPFSAAPGARLYRIGDLARYLPDGRLEFLGRVDF